MGVVCQPDRPAGRGLSLREPPVKIAARELGIEVHQPAKVKTGNLDQWLRERDVDVAVVLAYGRILPPAVLAVPRRGCMNLHLSLLPKYRGAAPINWAIVHGESETGVSLMQMDQGLDTGPVFTQRATPIGAHETAGELADRLAQLAAEVVRTDLPRAAAGMVEPKPQDDARATQAPLIHSDDTRVDWTHRAVAIFNLIRGMEPAPGAFTMLGGKRLRLHASRPSSELLDGTPGTVQAEGGRVFVQTGGGTLEILRAQLEGRRACDARDLLNGRILKTGDVLGH
jgi:methionyl-tRNA formyltransferase